MKLVEFAQIDDCSISMNTDLLLKSVLLIHYPDALHIQRGPSNNVNHVANAVHVQCLQIYR